MDTTKIPEQVKSDVMTMFNGVMAAGLAHNEWKASGAGLIGLEKWLEHREFARVCEDYRRERHDNLQRGLPLLTQRKNRG